jgi:FlaA1/EpsC-like NDP-sugar epimerase
MPVNKFAIKLLNASRQTKSAILLPLDVVLILMSLWLSFFLRMDTFVVADIRIVFIGLVAPVVAIPIFIRNGLYRAVIRYMTSDVIWAVLRAVTGYCMIWALLVLFSGVPVARSVILINWVVCLIFIGGSRFFAQWLVNVYLTTMHENSADTEVRKVLIYGAGEAGIQMAAGLSSHRETEVVGFIDDASLLQNQSIRGLKVFPSKDLDALVKKTEVSEILLAMPSVSRGRRSEIFTMLEPLPVQVRTLPDIAAIASGKVKVQDIREVDIADLLGRESVPPDENLLRKNIDGRVVMVTGAGGSIGSELCRQIAMLNPKLLILYEQSEFNLYNLDRELSRRELNFVSVLGSVYDENYITEQCRTLGVETIFHAAAYKHVPLVESNPKMGVRNNILGTYATARAAIEAGVDCFVMISTDKAVRPTNIMGATKRFSEQILHAMGELADDNQTKFIIVRFGNVIESSGSVIPLFREQINKGGPVTVTHRDVTRYFMTITEAAQLVIQAGAMGKGGEVFVLDMGKSVKIFDMAVKMIKLSGLTFRDQDNPDGDIEIKVSGLRAGEKLHEELLIGDNVSTTQHDRIMMANEKYLPWHEIEKKLDQLKAQVLKGNDNEIREILSSVVEGYCPGTTLDV